MQQGPPGFEESASPELLILVSVLVLVLGFLLGFAGRVVWRRVMSLIGAFLGGLLGFVFGTAFGGLLVGLLVSVLCAVVGSVVFAFLAQVGLGVVAGLLAWMIASSVTDMVLVPLAVAAVAFILTIAFIEQAIGVVTAIVGGLLVGIGMIWLGVTDMLLVVLGMFGTMVLGAGFQLSVIKEEGERRRRAVAAGVATGPVMAPRMCPKCGAPMSYVPERAAHYCQRCQRYG